MAETTTHHEYQLVCMLCEQPITAEQVAGLCDPPDPTNGVYCTDCAETHRG